VALVVLDASVLIAFLDPDDALHDAAVEALSEHQHDELLIPLTVYAEILVAPYRRGAEAVTEVEAFLADFAIRIEAMTPAIAQAAAQLRSASRSLRVPDALVLATGRRARSRQGAHRRPVMGSDHRPREAGPAHLTGRQGSSAASIPAASISSRRRPLGGKVVAHAVGGRGVAGRDAAEDTPTP
jgi:predicted nucleic acid-binding protein